jgi:hypothetical protein
VAQTHLSFWNRDRSNVALGRVHKCTRRLRSSIAGGKVIVIAHARQVTLMWPNPPVNADAREVLAHAVDRAARAGYRER